MRAAESYLVSKGRFLRFSSLFIYTRVCIIFKYAQIHAAPKQALQQPSPAFDRNQPRACPEQALAEQSSIAADYPCLLGHCTTSLSKFVNFYAIYILNEGNCSIFAKFMVIFARFAPFLSLFSNTEMQENLRNNILVNLSAVNFG